MGLSEDYGTHFLFYDGRSVQKAGWTPGDKPVIDGSGIVRTYRRGRILHTWFYPARYRLSKAHTLEFMPQELYLMNRAVTLKVDLPLYENRSESVPSDTAYVGDRAVIRSSDNVEWCLLETETGALGWFRVQGCCTVLGMDAGHVFDGLCFAD